MKNRKKQLKVFAVAISFMLLGGSTSATATGVPEDTDTTNKAIASTQTNATEVNSENADSNLNAQEMLREDKHEFGTTTIYYEPPVEKKTVPAVASPKKPSVVPAKQVDRGQLSTTPNNYSPYQNQPYSYPSNRYQGRPYSYPPNGYQGRPYGYPPNGYGYQNRPYGYPPNGYQGGPYGYPPNGN
jgi:hypothetical protein